MLGGKTALITGSTSGIGLAIARAMAGEGANVLLNGFGKADEIETIRAEIARARPRPVAVRTLELLAAAACAPDASGTGLRVLDRHGAARRRECTPDPTTLAARRPSAPWPG